VYFSTGPLQQSTMSFTGRMAATAYSPLTGGVASSNAGGFLSRNFAGTGAAAVEVHGASDEPLAVHVREGPGGPEATLEAVPELELATVPEVTAWVEREHDLGAEHTACVGPAGENEVRFASVMTTESRAFGRGGLGAALGAKGVKLLTFDGDHDHGVDVDDEAVAIHRDAATSESNVKRQETASVTDLANEIGSFPSYYFDDVRSRAASRSTATRSRRKVPERDLLAVCVCLQASDPRRGDGAGGGGAGVRDDHGVRRELRRRRRRGRDQGQQPL
jgi:aldehyde:ferredoxin oxidoreductase